MASSRDLVEAHSFSHRRLVAAFVSGPRDGREPEWSHAARPVIGGVALAGLLLAAAVIARVLGVDVGAEPSPAPDNRGMGLSSERAPSR